MLGNNLAMAEELPPASFSKSARTPPNVRVSIQASPVEKPSLVIKACNSSDGLANFKSTFRTKVEAVSSFKPLIVAVAKAAPTSSIVTPSCAAGIDARPKFGAISAMVARPKSTILKNLAAIVPESSISKPQACIASANNVPDSAALAPLTIAKLLASSKKPILVVPSPI